MVFKRLLGTDHGLLFRLRPLFLGLLGGSPMICDPAEHECGDEYCQWADSKGPLFHLPMTDVFPDFHSRSAQIAPRSHVPQPRAEMGMGMDMGGYGDYDSGKGSKGFSGKSKGKGKGKGKGKEGGWGSSLPPLGKGSFKGKGKGKG